MKGYKAFNKGLICKGKQYAENTVFEEEKAEICRSGMHFCKKPLDVLDYYSLVNEFNGEMSEFAEVEALDECKTDDGKTYCTKKLKIGSKISFAQLVEAGINFEKETPAETKVKITSKDSENIVNSSDYTNICSIYEDTKIGNSGKYAKICSSGDHARIGSSGDITHIYSSGYFAKIGSSGDYAKICSSGDHARIGSSGNSSWICSSGQVAQIGSSGYYSHIISSGDSAQIGSSVEDARISSSGEYAHIGNSGFYTQIVSSGKFAQIGSSGYGVQINSTGKYSVICCAGNNSIAKGKIGSWITLSEWKEEGEEYIPVCVKTEKIDGERIKEDTYYKLQNGEFVEVEG